MWNLCPERRDSTCSVPLLSSKSIRQFSLSDLIAFKIPHVPSSVCAMLRLYSQSFKILKAVESSVAVSNYI